MKKIVFYFVLWLFVYGLFVVDSFAVDKRLYKIEKGTILCNTYLAAETFVDLVRQNDQAAIDQLIASKRCSVAQVNLEAYQMDVMGVLAQFRFKGTNITGWGFRQDLNDKSENKKKSKKK